MKQAQLHNNNLYYNNNAQPQLLPRLCGWFRSSTTTTTTHRRMHGIPALVAVVKLWWLMIMMIMLIATTSTTTAVPYASAFTPMSSTTTTTSLLQRRRQPPQPPQQQLHPQQRPSSMLLRLYPVSAITADGIATGRRLYHYSTKTTHNIKNNRRHGTHSTTTSTSTTIAKTTTTTTTTELSLAATTSGLAMAAGAISGGLFAGGLHAIAGPDHLAALLPRCCGQRWYRACRVGALWGIGHGLSATLLGAAAFAIKTTVRHHSSGSSSTTGSSTLLLLLQQHPRLATLLSGASHMMEIAVGLSLVLIGVIGLREAHEWHGTATDHPVLVPQSLSAAANHNADDDDDDIAATTSSNSIRKDNNNQRAILFNGVLHGFSWDGAPSLAPALAMASWGGTLAFLSAYAFGTMTAMALVTTLVGEGTRQAGQVFQRPDLPQKFSYASSILAIVIGVVWCGLGFR